jgi:TonB family protein
VNYPEALVTRRTLTAFFMIVPAAAAALQGPSLVNMGEFTVRRVATAKALPDYPAASVARKTAGVAVAAFTSDTSGKVASVTILEAPDDAIAAAVRAAVERWQIPPVTVRGVSQPHGHFGKLTFYFRIVGGKGVVSHPEDMPGGPRPEPPGGPPTASPGLQRGGPSTPAVVIGGHRSSATEIDEAEFTALAAKLKPTVLDIRDRTDFRRRHRDGAVNIPADELSVRGWIEIDRTRSVVIDCSALETMRCHNAAERLSSGPKIQPLYILIP